MSVENRVRLSPGSPNALVLSVLTVRARRCRHRLQVLDRQRAAGPDDFAELSPAQALAYYSDTKAHGESPGSLARAGVADRGLVGRAR